MKQALSLQHILQSDTMQYGLEAHDALSALLVEQAGFDVIWASGLCIAAALGHRDCNEISWTELCRIVEYMARATKTPILVDGDTGFGDFNNTRELVKKLELYGAAGVAIEDKKFPKTNSFLPYNQQLVDIKEFVGKIKAAKDSQKTNDFCFVARTEAFIAGAGLDEALKRSYAYAEAGADAIIVHSKKTTAIQIENFIEHWKHTCPIVIIPTTYASTSTKDFEKLQVKLVIWGNHMLRACIQAMQETAIQLQHRTHHDINSSIAPIDQVFDLMNVKELKEAQDIYHGS